MKAAITAAVLALTAATAARAEVVDVQPTGFEVRQSVQLKAQPGDAYAALLEVGSWWNHSWSGDPSNLYLEPTKDGCWCETLADGGFVRHMTITFAEPGKQIRLFGGLGPMQMTGLAGHLVWELEPKDGGTEVVWTYDVGGYAKGGTQMWSKAVDGVLAEQIGRFAKFADTGSAD